MKVVHLWGVFLAAIVAINLTFLNILSQIQNVLKSTKDIN